MGEVAHKDVPGQPAGTALFEQVNMGGRPLTVILFVPSYDVNLGVYRSVSAGLCRLGLHPDRAKC